MHTAVEDKSVVANVIVNQVVLARIVDHVGLSESVKQELRALEGIVLTDSDNPDADPDFITTASIQKAARNMIRQIEKEGMGFKLPKCLKWNRVEQL